MARRPNALAPVASDLVERIRVLVGEGDFERDTSSGSAAIHGDDRFQVSDMVLRRTGRRTRWVPCVSFGARGYTTGDTVALTLVGKPVCESRVTCLALSMALISAAGDGIHIRRRQKRTPTGVHVPSGGRK
jgi:hypothetical protein